MTHHRGKFSHRSANRPTLLMSTPELPAAPHLSSAALSRGWSVEYLNSHPTLPDTDIVFYGSTLDAQHVARSYHLALLEPPLDLLSRLPPALLLRRVNFCRWNQLPQSSTPQFIKPADPLAKSFDAGIYHVRHDVRLRHPLPATTPVLISDPVEWLGEYRCFILEGKVVASSPYLSFGRPLHHRPDAIPALPPAVIDVCRRLTLPPSPALPPAFVVDVGLIEDRGWSVVEFNPAWCSGLLSANPAPVLDVLHRSCLPVDHLTPSDRHWLISRP